LKDKELRLKTTLITKERLIDQKLPTSLRVWTDAEYRATLNSPQPERLKTDSDGFTHRADAKKLYQNKQFLSMKRLTFNNTL